MPRVELVYQSELSASPTEAWRWITSVKGISKELWPILRMTVPRGLERLDDLQPTPGTPLFRSWMLLFGILPVDYSDLTLLQIENGSGFVEQSPMASMKLWRHERSIVPNGSGSIVVDRLAFEPKRMPALTAWLIRRLFAHRHVVLRRNLGLK